MTPFNTEKQVQSIDELISELKEEDSHSVYIDASIQEALPDSHGFPVHYRYKPVITVTCDNTAYKYLSDDYDESPDEEKVRASVRVKSLEIGLDIADAATGTLIKINDLPLEQANKQLDLYKLELAKIQEAHKNGQHN